MILLAIPLGKGVLLARALHRKFLEPLSPADTHGREEIQ